MPIDRNATTLGKRVPSDQPPVEFRTAVAQRLEQARNALDPRDPITPRHLGALSTFLDSLGDYGPKVTDPRTYSLYLLANFYGGESIQLTPTQNELLARLGVDPIAAPSPDVTLSELVSVGIEDVLDKARGDLGAAKRERNEALDRAVASGHLSEELAQLRSRLQVRDEEIGKVQGELEVEQRNVAYLREAGRSGSPEKPRRIKLDGEEGIYYTDTPEGRMYEYRVRLPDGSRPWIRTGLELDDCIAQRLEAKEAAAALSAEVPA